MDALNATEQKWGGKSGEPQSGAWGKQLSHSDRVIGGRFAIGNLQARLVHHPWSGARGEPLLSPGPADWAGGKQDVSRAQGEMCMDRAFGKGHSQQR